jgi:HIRAN domain
MTAALFVAWRGGDANNGSWGPVGRLEYDDGLYRFYYTQGARTVKGFRPFSQMEDLDQVYESDELFPLFANRLLSRRRPEYDAYLQWGGFPRGSQPDPIALLSVTEGRRQTDSVEVFPCPVPDANGCYLNKFFLHGVRWMSAEARQRLLTLKVDERLYVMMDVCNSRDPNAVAVRTDSDRTLIGYVPRYLAADVWELWRQCRPEFLQLFVQQVNQDSPMQQRLLCRMQACWPEGFQPCAGEAFQPIPVGMTATCAGEGKP